MPGADERLAVSVSIYHLGLAGGFDFDDYDFDQFNSTLTHVSAETLGIAP